MVERVQAGKSDCSGLNHGSIILLLIVLGEVTSPPSVPLPNLGPLRFFSCYYTGLTGDGFMLPWLFFCFLTGYWFGLTHSLLCLVFVV